MTDPISNVSASTESRVLLDGALWHEWMTSLDTNTNIESSDVTPISSDRTILKPVTASTTIDFTVNYEPEQPIEDFLAAFEQIPTGKDARPLATAPRGFKIGRQVNVYHIGTATAAAKSPAKEAKSIDFSTFQTARSFNGRLKEARAQGESQFPVDKDLFERGFSYGSTWLAPELLNNNAASAAHEEFYFADSTVANGGVKLGDTAGQRLPIAIFFAVWDIDGTGYGSNYTKDAPLYVQLSELNNTTPRSAGGGRPFRRQSVPLGDRQAVWHNGPAVMGMATSVDGVYGFRLDFTPHTPAAPLTSGTIDLKYAIAFMQGE